MEKSITIGEGDRPVWERAELVLGDRLPDLLTGVLRQFLSTHEQAPATDVQGLTRIMVWLVDDEGRIRPRAFRGRLLIANRASTSPEVALGTMYSVAQTAGGRVAVWHGKEGREADAFDAYDSLEAAQSPTAGVPADILAAAAEALGAETEELDI